MKILLVEDEIDLNNIVTKYLKKNGYSVDSVFDGEEALDYLEYGEYDLIILDVMMPKLNGFEVIKELRNKGNHTSVLMLTARDSADDKVKGLDLGADDYLVKPFDFNELSARIRAVVRRKYGNSSNKLIIGDLVIDSSEKSVTRAGKEIDLTGKEYEVLEYLVQNKNRILSRDQIKEHVWDYDYKEHQKKNRCRKWKTDNLYKKRTWIRCKGRGLIKIGNHYFKTGKYVYIVKCKYTV